MRCHIGRCFAGVTDNSRIGGKMRLIHIISSWVDNENEMPSSTGDENTYENLAPNNGKPICRVRVPSADLIQRALEASSLAFVGEWSKSSALDRGDRLRAMASVLRDQQDVFVEIEALDTGIPITQVRNNHIPAAIQTLEYYASLVSTGLEGRILDVPHGGGHRDSFAYTRREPLGVCVGIGAWNYPLTSMMWKIAPALACGNTVVYKPSECTPMTAVRFAKATSDCLPPNALQVLVGDGRVAQQLIQHDKVRKVSLTGSVPTGQKVVQQAGLKRTTLELGGKSAILVFADADIESSVRVVAQGNFVNNGQVCSNCTRVLVHRSILDTFLAKLVALVRRHTSMGDNMVESTNMGPVMMPPNDPSGHFDGIMDIIRGAKEDPLVDLVEGGRGHQEDGAYFVEPTIFLSHSDGADVVQKEIFGPVATVLAFDSEEEAIERANATEFGLAAGVMTTDANRAHRVVKRLQAGVTYINHWNLSPVEMPFGPSKLSGHGNELGPEALQEYSQVKSVYVETGSVDELW